MSGPLISGPQPNIIVTPDPNGQYNRYDTYIATDPNNPAHMVGICRRFFGPGINYQDTLEFQSSNDSGQSWNYTALPLANNYYSISDPWIGIAPNGNIYVIALLVNSSFDGVAVCCYSSTNNGQTWNFTVIPGSNGGSPDNTFGAIDPITNSVYAIWDSNDEEGAGAGYSFTLAFASSLDGINWNASPAALAGGNSIYDLTQQGFDFVNISVAPDDGLIHIIGAAGDGVDNSIYSYARSTDHGQTFSFGVIATQQPGTGDIGYATTPQMLAPVNPPAILAAGNGLVFAAWSVDTGQPTAVPGPQMRICIASCSDGGVAWANTIAVNAPTVAPFMPLGTFSQTPQDQYFQPRLAAMPDGTVGCLFLYCVVGPYPSPLTVAQISTCLAVSYPDAAYPTYFDPNSTTVVTVSSQTTSPMTSNPVLRWGDANAYFIGDFIGLARNASGFMAYWSDTRTQNPSHATAQIITSFLVVQNETCSIIVDRGTYGEDEVNAMLAGATSASFSDAIYVVVDGLAPTQLGLNASNLQNPPLVSLPAFNGTLLKNLGVKLVFDTSSKTGGVQLENTSNLNAVQRITYPFNLVFSIPAGSQSLQAFNALNASGAGFAVYDLAASVTTIATGGNPSVTLWSSRAEIEFVTQADPYMEAGETWWLSNDIRVFTVTPATLNDQAPLPYSTTLYGSSPNDYISALINELNTNFTDPANQHTPFNAIPSGEDQRQLMLTQNANGNPVFNFALARLHLKGDVASNVRTFFRLFISPSPDTDFDAFTTFRSLSETDSTGNNIQETLIPMLGFPTTDMTSTIPFFAAPRIDSTTQSMTEQTDPQNVQTIPSPLIQIPPAAGTEVYAYYGCWLDINQPTSQFPINPSTASTPNGPWLPGEILPIPAIIMGNHACLVAEISYDPDPIQPGMNAATSDKIGQRNLSWYGSDNPGPAAGHRIPTLFDIRPTRVITPSELPDELMIEWGHIPIGSQALIYWPGIDAQQVLEWANRIYSTHNFTKTDKHTIRCVTGTVSYIPIPPGTGPNLAGLLTIDLPRTVKVGQEFNVVVRRLSSRMVGKANAPVRDAKKWRYVIGAFQIRIPVNTSAALLSTEESILALYRWKMEQIPAGNRWYPVLRRLVGCVEGRVDAFGGNAASIGPSLGGGHNLGRTTPGHLLEITGKILGIRFDRFGDFEGFNLMTESGSEEYFFAREQAMELRVTEAWQERMTVSVLVERSKLHEPVMLLLRRPNRR